MSGPDSQIVFVTGTSTGVGKTVTTAALAACAVRAGRRVCVIKPAQTGEEPGSGDLTEVLRLLGPLAGSVTTVEPYRFPSPLAPVTAARVDELPEVDVSEVVRQICTAAEQCDVVLVEGAGGALVRFDSKGSTLLDIAQHVTATLTGSHAISEPGSEPGLDSGPAPGSDPTSGPAQVGALTVASSGLGTLNHTALTLEAIEARGLLSYGVVVGSWPSEPDLAERNNLADLTEISGMPLVGIVPEGAPEYENFDARAQEWISPRFDGRFQAPGVATSG